MTVTELKVSKKSPKFIYTKHLIGTTWDIKKPRINSPYRELRYAKKNKDGIKYWTALINIRKIIRKKLDIEWEKNKKKVKTKNDFYKYVQEPAERKIENFFHRDIGSLYTGNFGNKLIKKYSLRTLTKVQKAFNKNK